MIYARCPSGARLGNWMFTYAAAVSTGEPVTVECPLPEDFQKVLRRLTPI